MSQPPNILFLFSDQHNASTVGYENHPDVLTPHLDRLAAEGTEFNLDFRLVQIRRNERGERQ